MSSFSLGMDSTSFSGHDMVLTIPNLDIPRVVSVLHTDKKADINRFLEKIPLNIKKR